jgi:hypothetical protein
VGLAALHPPRRHNPIITLFLGSLASPATPKTHVLKPLTNFQKRFIFG